jgi:hypothetical protein
MIIDKVLNVEASESKYQNEIQTLQDLFYGLNFLYNAVKPWELKILENRPGKNITFQGVPPFFIMDGIPNTLLDYLPSTFHWFSTSLINYSRLTGFLVERIQNNITDEDVINFADKSIIKNACNNYVKNIPELRQVLKWRNKVSAHFALTDPYHDDNIATLQESIRNPISFSDFRFWTHIMIISKSTEKEIIESTIPTWSLTETFEALNNRFWTI